MFDKWLSPLKMFLLQDGPVYQTNGRNRTEVVVVVKFEIQLENTHSLNHDIPVHTCTFVYLLCGDFMLDFPLNFNFW